MSNAHPSGGLKEVRMPRHLAAETFNMQEVDIRVLFCFPAYKTEMQATADRKNREISLKRGLPRL